MLEISLKSSDLLYLSASLFEVNNPVGVVQIICGYKEYKERYYELISILNNNKLNVIISDIRGHGKSVDNNNPLGFMSDYNKLISDQSVVFEYIKNRYNSLPVYLFGDSIGSEILLGLFLKYENQINKIVLVSPVKPNDNINLWLKTANFINKFQGGTKCNSFLEGALGLSKLEFLFQDLNARELFKNNPLCNFSYFNISVKNILELNKYIANIKFNGLNKNLPILICYGDNDTEIGGKMASDLKINTFNKSGYTNIKVLNYPSAAHKILFEQTRNLIYNDIANFLIGG